MDCSGSAAQLHGLAGERMINSMLQVGHTLEATHRHLMLFDIVPHRLDARLLRAVGGQRHHMHVCCGLLRGRASTVALLCTA